MPPVWPRQSFTRAGKQSALYQRWGSPPMAPDVQYELIGMSDFVYSTYTYGQADPIQHPPEPTQFYYSALQSIPWSWTQAFGSSSRASYEARNPEGTVLPLDQYSFFTRRFNDVNPTYIGLPGGPRGVGNVPIPLPAGGSLEGVIAGYPDILQHYTEWPDAIPYPTREYTSSGWMRQFHSGTLAPVPYNSAAACHYQRARYRYTIQSQGFFVLLTLRVYSGANIVPGTWPYETYYDAGWTKNYELSHLPPPDGPGPLRPWDWNTPTYAYTHVVAAVTKQAWQRDTPPNEWIEPPIDMAWFSTSDVELAAGIVGRVMLSVDFETPQEWSARTNIPITWASE